MNHKFLPDVAIADIAYRAEGKTREELFGNCAIALTEAMADLGKIKGAVKKGIAVEGKNDDELLYNFLSELVYIKDVDGLLFKKFNVKFSGSAKMEAQCFGDTLDNIGRENLNNDVKAITMYLFGIKKENGKYVATVVVDI